MKTFNVTLTRAYKVQIEAENEDLARKLVEFYLGDPEDKSNEKERSLQKFNIIEIELTLNDALEVEEVKK